MYQSPTATLYPSMKISSPSHLAFYLIMLCNFFLFFSFDFHGCGFSPRFSRASGSRGTNHRLQASRPLGGGLIRRKAFQAGVYPPPAQPTGFSR
jgi:hypothetical protein